MFHRVCILDYGTEVPNALATSSYESFNKMLDKLDMVPMSHEMYLYSQISYYVSQGVYP